MSELIFHISPQIEPLIFLARAALWSESSLGDQRSVKNKEQRQNIRVSNMRRAV